MAGAPSVSTATFSRGTTIATGAPAASAARAATRASPSPLRTASSISRWTARSRATRPAAPAGPPPGAAARDAAGSWLTVRPSGDRSGVGVGLEDFLAGLAGPHAVGVVDRQHEDLPVADGPGPRVLEDRVHDRLHVTVGDDALELDLRPQVVRQLRSAVALGDALLAPGSLDLA